MRVSWRFRYGAEEDWWAKPHTLPSVRLTQERKETEANTTKTTTGRKASWLKEVGKIKGELKIRK